LEKIRPMAVVIACGHDRDFASRFFVPYVGIGEDPAIGSARAALVPSWTKKLGRSEFTALQARARTGALHCRQEGNRAELGGRCLMLIVGQFQL
jgi:predicted PhzF superfamily epimerase YddE/YHI9